MNNAGCRLDALQFVSPAVGYAVGGGDAFVVVARTDDGGATCKVIYTSTDDTGADGVFFTNDTTGFMRVSWRKLDATSDGGKTWHGVPTPAAERWRILFPDPEVGWICSFRNMTFTTDGGRRWSSRDFHFPTDVYGWSFPKRDRAYVVGQHGMVYRYRIVPVEYSRKGMIDAPMMPASAMKAE